MRGITLGMEILATCAAWSIAGWVCGKQLAATWPVVVFSMAGIVHALFLIVRTASRKP